MKYDESCGALRAAIYGYETRRQGEARIPGVRVAMSLLLTYGCWMPAWVLLRTAHILGDDRYVTL